MRKIVAGAGLCLVLLSAVVFSAYADQALCSMHDGMAADGKTVLEKQGKKYEFCCSGCLQKFKDAPETFTDKNRSSVPSGSVSPEATCGTVCSD